MSSTKNNYAVPFAIMTFLLFLLGFVTWINSILVPFLQYKFNISPSDAQLVNSAFYGAYIISIPVGGFVKMIGYKKSAIIGTLLTGIGTAIFVPAVSISFGMVLAGLFITAIGIVIIQVVANPYIIALGDPETSSSRLTLAMAANSIAAGLAPLIGSLILVKQGDAPVDENAAVILFTVLAAIVIITGIILIFMHLPAIHDDKEEAGKKGRSAWSYPHLLLGFVGITMYIGLEVGVASYFVNYAKFNLGISADKASQIMTFYFIGFIIGRLAGGAVLRKFSPNAVLTFNLVSGLVLISIFFVTKGTDFSMYPLLLLGLFFSIMWPVIFDMALKDVHPSAAKLGSGIISTGVVFVGVWTWLMGKYVESTTPEGGTPDYGSAYIFFYLFFAYLIFYALKGSKIRVDK
jgi:FHS family L-fucose permease-like MFS transporter